MPCRDRSCAPPPIGSGGSRKIAALKALAEHPATPPHEAASAKRRIAVLVKRYGSDVSTIKASQTTSDWLTTHYQKAKSGPRPGTKAFNDAVTAKLNASRAHIDSLRPVPKKQLGR